MRLFAPIAKIDESQRLVFGYASTEALDSQGEIVRKEAIEAALPDYMRFANIREMHLPSAVAITAEEYLQGTGYAVAAGSQIKVGYTPNLDAPAPSVN